MTIMQLKLNRRSPLGLKEQIKRQIRRLAESGELVEGQALPASRDLAALLNVNRNTAWAAYRELTAEGLLRTVPGGGTFLARMEKRDDMAELERILSKALQRAAELGVDSARAADLFQDLANARQALAQSLRILVVECNRETLKSLAGELERGLGVKSKGALIQDLEADPGSIPGLVQGVDLVVCGFNHLAEFRALAPSCPVDSLGVMIEPNIRLLARLDSLAPGSKVAFICANQRSTENLYKHQVFQGGVSLARTLVGLDDPDKVAEAVKDADLIFASSVAYDRVRALAPPDKEVVMVEIFADPAALEAVREHLAGLGRR